MGGESQTVRSTAEYINLLQQMCFRPRHETKKSLTVPKHLQRSISHPLELGTADGTDQGASSRHPSGKKTEKCWDSPVHLGKQAVL